MLKRSSLVALILFQMFVILILLMTMLTPKEYCAKILSFYDLKDQPVEVSILRSEYTYIAGGNLQSICRYKRITIDGLTIEYYNDRQID